MRSAACCDQTWPSRCISRPFWQGAQRRVVELAVELERLHRIRRPDGGDAVAQVAQLGHVGAGGDGAGDGGGVRLEQLAQLVDLEQVAVGELGHERAPVRLQPHQPVALQPAQRLAHRRLRHAELAGHRVLVDALVRRQPAAHDRHAQRVVNRRR